MANHEYVPVSRRVYECEKAMLDSLPQSTISVNCHNQEDQQLVYTKMNQIIFLSCVFKNVCVMRYFNAWQCRKNTFAFTCILDNG